MIAIIDYGMGNLRSVQKALESTGARTRITQNPADLKTADKIVLPGVGAIKPAMARLTELGLITEIKAAIKSGKPFLGICLGMQLLFERASEGGNVPALGILKGSVDLFTPHPEQNLKVPHMGWNQLNLSNPKSLLWQGLPQTPSVYFCHSYFANPGEKAVIAATTEYGINFAAAVAKDNIFAVQFHPEKSQRIGLKIMENFNQL